MQRNSKPPPWKNHTGQYRVQLRYWDSQCPSQEIHKIDHGRDSRSSLRPQQNSPWRCPSHFLFQESLLWDLKAFSPGPSYFEEVGRFEGILGVHDQFFEEVLSACDHLVDLIHTHVLVELCVWWVECWWCGWLNICHLIVVNTVLDATEGVMFWFDQI